MYCNRNKIVCINRGTVRKQAVCAQENNNLEEAEFLNVENGCVQVMQCEINGGAYKFLKS